MRYDKVKKNASQLLSLTGFTVSEFESLLPTFQYEWEGYYSHFTLKGEVRQRISYSRKTSKLPMTADKLLFILSYLKNSPLQEYHGATFGMTQPQCNDWVHLLSDILRKTLKTLGELPDRNSQRMQYVGLFSKFPLLTVESQKLSTVSRGNLLNNPKKITDEQPIHFPVGITLWQDTGFQGHTPENVIVKMPTKKPKGKELTQEQKDENRKISSFRILVEHAIGGVKRCRIVKERFRCTKFAFEDIVMLIACGLHNFRISLKYSEIIN